MMRAFVHPTGTIINALKTTIASLFVLSGLACTPAIAADLSAEFDGLIGVGFDIGRQQSFASVFDAQNLSAGPLALARLPYWVPYGFHGHFYAS